MTAELVSARQNDLLKYVGDIVAAYVSNNSVAASDLPGVIKSIHATLGTLSGAAASDVLNTQKPAVPIKKSVTNQFIVCLEDGMKLKMLKRYLQTQYNLTPEEYRAKWGLPGDYPMVAPNYSAQRSELAKKSGLGRNASRPKAKRRP